MILHKKEAQKTLKITGLSVYFPTCTKCSHGYHKNEWKKVLDENQPSEQAGFRKGCSTVDHLQTINQLTEKCNDFNRPLYIGYIDYEKPFDSIEHVAISKALRTICIHEVYIAILEDIYTEATARVHMNNQISEEILILRGVKQEDLVFPKLFTAAIQEVFRMRI